MLNLFFWKIKLNPSFLTMQKLAIIVGGKSPEHDISIISGRNIYKAIDLNKYSPLVIGISKTGQWFHLLGNSLFDEKLDIGNNNNHLPLYLIPFDHSPVRYINDHSELKIDVFFPITHGVLGEDGTLQGLIEHLNLPYVGPSVLGSSIGMDKDVTKTILAQNGIMVTPWKTFYKGDNINLNNLIDELGTPLFVKPANMGSGVGVEKATNIDELNNAIQNAFNYDIKIIIEKGINGREVETAALGNNEIKISGVGEIIVQNGFYTYENKYINNETKVVIPIENFSNESVELIRNTAKKAYKALQLEGLSRIDFFFVNNNEFYLNEVNTLPGFTNISMYPKLWEAQGLSYTDLISELALLAIQRHELKNLLKRNL